MIADPLLEDEAVQLTVDLPSSLEVAVTLVGPLGTLEGVAVVDAVGPVPTLFVAATVNVYKVPFVSPVNVHPVAVLVRVVHPVAVIDPPELEAVTV